ncbi:15971_t:CDS:2, partial [Acaulospora morrowiae]
NKNISDSTSTSIEEIERPMIDMSICIPNNVIVKLGECYDETLITTNNKMPRKEDRLQIMITYEYRKKVAKSYSNKTAKEFSNNAKATAAKLNEKNNVELKEYNNKEKISDPCKKIKFLQEPENDDPSKIPNEHGSMPIGLVYKNMKPTSSKTLMNTDMEKHLDETIVNYPSKILKEYFNNDEALAAENYKRNNNINKWKNKQKEADRLKEVIYRLEDRTSYDKVEGNLNEKICSELLRKVVLVDNYIKKIDKMNLADDEKNEGQKLTYDKILVNNDRPIEFELDMGMTVTLTDLSSIKNPPIPMDHRDQEGGLNVNIGNGNRNHDTTSINSDILVKKEFEASKHEHMMKEQ